MKKRNKLDERPETEKCVRFNVEKNVLVEYLWGRPEEHRIQHAAPSETHEDEVPNHTQLLSSHFNNTFSPRHIRVKLADLLRVIEEERQHIRNRKFSISSDGTFKFKREKRRGFLHIMRDIKEIIACMRAYIAKHSSDTIVNKSELLDSTNTALGLFSLSVEMENIRKLVVAGQHEASMRVDEEADTMERIRAHKGDIIPTEDLQAVEEHLTFLHELFLLHADKWTEEVPIETMQEIDEDFEEYLVKSCFVSSLEHFIDEYSEYDDTVTKEDMQRLYPDISVEPPEIDMPYCEEKKEVEIDDVEEAPSAEVVLSTDEGQQIDFVSLVNVTDIIEHAVRSVVDILYDQQQAQQAQEVQKEDKHLVGTSVASNEQKCQTLEVPSVTEETIISAENSSSDEQDISRTSPDLPISAPQLPSELVIPLVPTPGLSPRPIQLRGSFIPTKHSPTKPQHEIYRVTTHVSSEKSDVISRNITDASSSSHLPSQHDENRQISLNSAHIDTSQLTHSSAMYVYQKGRKLKAKLPSYMQGMMDRGPVLRKHIPSLTQARVEDIAIDLSQRLLLYSSATGQNTTIPLEDIVPTESRIESMITLRTRDHQYITCIQATEWRHILTLLERRPREASPSRQSDSPTDRPAHSELRSNTAPTSSSRKRAYARQQHKYQPSHAPVHDLAFPALTAQEDLHKRPFLVTRHAKTAEAAANRAYDSDLNPLAVKPVPPATTPHPSSPMRQSVTSHSKRPTTQAAKRPRTEPRSSRPARPGTTHRPQRQRMSPPLEDSIDLSLDSSISIGL